VVKSSARASIDDPMSAITRYPGPTPVKAKGVEGDVGLETGVVEAGCGVVAAPSAMTARLALDVSATFACPAVVEALGAGCVTPGVEISSTTDFAEI